MGVFLKTDIKNGNEILAFYPINYLNNAGNQTEPFEGWPCMKTLAKNVEAAMRNFHISLKEACEGLGTTVEEYEKAKNVTS